MAYNLNQQTSYFLKKKGLTLSDLNNHEQIDDAILICNIKDEFLNEMTPEQEGYIAALWSIVYYNKKPLKTKHINKLEQLTNTLLSRRLAKQHKQQIFRNKVNRLKSLSDENPVTNVKWRGTYDD